MTMTELEDYAKYLGINSKDEPQFLWIARESLKSPLPKCWNSGQDYEGNP
jgi:hypothetical protein